MLRRIFEQGKGHTIKMRLLKTLLDENCHQLDTVLSSLGVLSNVCRLLRIEMHECRMISVTMRVHRRHSHALDNFLKYK